MEKKIIRERGSATKTQIIQVLSERNEALAHKDFQDFFKGTCDRVTIYRALDRLVDEGKIHKITGIEGVIQYALCKNCKENHYHNHVHFNCLNCKKVVCIENSIPSISLPNGYLATEIQCMVSGTCPDCSTNL